MPLAGLHTGAEAFQGPVHVGGAHAKAHGREATQVHGELAGDISLGNGTPGWGGHRNVIADMGMASGRALPGQPLAAAQSQSSPLCLGYSYLQVRPWG